MADNSVRTPGSGESIRTVDKAGIKSEVVVIDWGGSGTEDLSNGPCVVEDAAHAAGELLAGVAARRTDTPASSAGTDADWSTLNNDALGLLWTRLPARHRTAQFSLVTQASAVAANDQLCDELELTGMALVAAGAGRILNMVLVSNNTTQIAAEGWIYQLNPSPAGTNAVHDQSDANMKTARSIGYIDFSTWVTETSNIMSVGTFRGMPLCSGPGLPYQCNDGTNTTSLWIVMVTRTAVTPGATTDYYLEIAYEPGV